MSVSAHWDKHLYDGFQYEADSYKSAFAADKHHSRKSKHQSSGNRETVCQNLNVYRNVVGKKALYPKHGNRNKGCDAKINEIFY